MPYHSSTHSSQKSSSAIKPPDRRSKFIEHLDDVGSDSRSGGSGKSKVPDRVNTTTFSSGRAVSTGSEVEAVFPTHAYANTVPQPSRQDHARYRNSPSTPEAAGTSSRHTAIGSGSPARSSEAGGSSGSGIDPSSFTPKWPELLRSKYYVTPTGYPPEFIREKERLKGKSSWYPKYAPTRDN